MLAIRDSAVDMSPFVRKTAAHAIPKLYSIDSDQKEELVGLIEKLLADRTTLVVGSGKISLCHWKISKSYCHILFYSCDGL